MTGQRSNQPDLRPNNGAQCSALHNIPLVDVGRIWPTATDPCRTWSTRGCSNLGGVSPNLVELGETWSTSAKNCRARPERGRYGPSSSQISAGIDQCLPERAYRRIGPKPHLKGVRTGSGWLNEFGRDSGDAEAGFGRSRAETKYVPGWVLKQEIRLHDAFHFLRRRLAEPASRIPTRSGGLCRKQ